jgi:hypothetical protein
MVEPWEFIEKQYCVQLRSMIFEYYFIQQQKFAKRRIDKEQTMVGT